MDIESHTDMFLGCKSQDRLLKSDSLSSLNKIRFSDQEFATGTLVSNFKFNYLRSQNYNLFYPFHNQLDYVLAHYFAKSKITKSNVDKFLSELLIAPLTEKLSYQNANKWIKKLSEITKGISNDKWTEHKFELENGITRMPG